MLYTTTAVKTYKDAWIEQFNLISKLEKTIPSKITKAELQVARNKLIMYWNKLTPSQQKEIACIYQES